MAPPVDRETKYKRSTMPQPEPSYVNYGVTPQRPQNLPLVKTLAGNPFVGSLPNQPNRWSVEPTDDLDYCPMQAPKRTELTRCYSYDREDATRSRAPDNDQCYEDMSALQTRRYSSGKSNSSSSSSLVENEDVYMPMVPSQVGAGQSFSLMLLKAQNEKLQCDVLCVHNLYTVAGCLYHSVFKWK